MRHTRLSAKDPDDDAADPTFGIVSPLDWRDQVVLAGGVIYRATPATEIRLGGSRTRNPVPDHTLNATLPLINETVVAVGLMHHWTARWTLNTSLAWSPPITEHYDNALTGPSSERAEVVVLYLGVRREW